MGTTPDETAKWITVTLDTNVIWDYIDPIRKDHPAAKKLMELYEGHWKNIALTTRLDVDVPNGEVREKIDGLQVMSIGTGFTLDTSRLGGGDFIVDDDWPERQRQIMSRLFPNADENSPEHKNRLADVDHLMGHQASGRDYFVTRDKGISEHKDWLRDKHGIKVASPEDFLSEIER